MPTEITTRPAPDGAIRVNLTMPVTRIGFGPFSVDPLQEVIGAPLSEILSSLMVRPVFRRPSEAGPAVEVYALALPDGEGAAVPLGQWGEVGFRNARSLLVLTVPLPMAAGRSPARIRPRSTVRPPMPPVISRRMSSPPGSRSAA